MEQVERIRLADQLRRALYAAGFIIALASVWALGWSRTLDTGLPDDFGNPEPTMAPIAAHARADRHRSEPRPIVADVRE